MSTQLHPHGLKFFSRPGFISDFNRKKQHLHHVPRAMIKDRSAPNLLQIRPKTAQAFEKPQGTGKFFSRPDFMSEFNRNKLHLRHVPHNMIKDRSAPDLRQFKQRKAAKPSYPQGYKLFSKPEFMSDLNKRKSHLRRVPQNMIKDRSAPDLRQFKQRRGAKRPHFETAKLFSKPEFMSDFNKRKSHLRHLPRSAIKDRSAPNLLQFKQRKSTKQAHPQSYKLFSKPEFMSDFNKKKMHLRHLPQNMIRDRSSPNLLLLKQEKWQSKWMPKSQKASMVAPYTRQNFKYFSRPDFMSEFNRKKVHLRHIPYSMMRDRSAPDLLLLKQEKWQNQWSRGAQKGFVAPPAGRTGMVQELRESVQRPAVLREKIIPIEEEDVQPIVHRQIERREIHEVVQPIHERQVLPATVEERQLPAENRQFGNIQKRVPIVQPNTTETAPATRSKIVNPPIIQETVRKTVIEEIQPVVHRDTITTRIIRETLPIYEKVIEPEVVIKEVRPVLEHALDAPSTTGLKSSGTFGEKYAFDIEQKTTLQPGAASRFGRPLHK